MPARLAIITSQSDNSDDEMEVQSRSRAVTHETGEVSSESDAGSSDEQEQVCEESPVSALASSATDVGVAGRFQMTSLDSVHYAQFIDGQWHSS